MWFSQNDQSFLLSILEQGSLKTAVYPGPEPWVNRRYICLITAGNHLFTQDGFTETYNVPGTELRCVDKRRTRSLHWFFNGSLLIREVDHY